VPHKSKIANGHHLGKIVKLPYFPNRLTDFEKIWYGDAPGLKSPASNSASDI